MLTFNYIFVNSVNMGKYFRFFLQNVTICIIFFKYFINHKKRIFFFISCANIIKLFSIHGNFSSRLLELLWKVSDFYFLAFLLLHNFRIFCNVWIILFSEFIFRIILQHNKLSSSNICYITKLIHFLNL